MRGLPPDNGTPGAIKAILDRKAPKPDTEPEDMGQCASRPGNKWISCLHVHDGPKAVYSFQYNGLAVRNVFEPGQFVVCFRDPNEAWRLTVKGRNLWPVYNYICQARLEWIRPADRDFVEDSTPVITEVVIERVERERRT